MGRFVPQLQIGPVLLIISTVVSFVLTNYKFYSEYQGLKPSGETGYILYYVQTVSFVLQTYNLVWVILWQIWTVLACRLGCGPFSFVFCSMLTAWYIDYQGSEPNGETSQFLTGSILYYVRIAATTLLAWPRIWSSVITTRIAWVNNALIAHNSQKGYWQFFIS